MKVLQNSMTTSKKRLINKSLSSTIDAKPKEMFKIIIIFPVAYWYCKFKHESTKNLSVE